MQYYYLNTVKGYLYENEMLSNKKKFSEKVNHTTIQDLFDVVYFYGDSFFLDKSQIQSLLIKFAGEFVKPVDIDKIPQFTVQNVIENLKAVDSSQLDLTFSTKKASNNSIKYTPAEHILKNRKNFYSSSLEIIIENLGNFLCSPIVSLDVEYDICREFPISEFGTCVFNHSIDNFKNVHLIVDCPKSKAKSFEYGESLTYNQEDFKSYFNKFITTHKNSVMIGHAIHNDINILKQIFPEHAATLDNMLKVDTANIYRWMNGTSQEPSLKDFLKDMQIGFKSSSLHNAGNDAFLAMKGFVKFFNDWQDIYDRVSEQNTKLLKKASSQEAKPTAKI